jgi:hypothetical protein
MGIAGGHERPGRANEGPVPRHDEAGRLVVRVADARGGLQRISDRISALRIGAHVAEAHAADVLTSPVADAMHGIVSTLV